MTGLVKVGYSWNLDEIYNKLIMFIYFLPNLLTLTDVIQYCKPLYPYIVCTLHKVSFSIVSYHNYLYVEYISLRLSNACVFVISIHDGGKFSNLYPLYCCRLSLYVATNHIQNFDDSSIFDVGAICHCFR